MVFVQVIRRLVKQHVGFLCAYIMPMADREAMSSRSSSVMKKPKLIKVKVLGNSHNYPVKDYSEEIGSFCNRVVNKLVRTTLINTHSPCSLQL